MNPIPLDDKEILVKNIQYRLHWHAKKQRYLRNPIGDVRQISSVLFLLGYGCGQTKETSSPCVVLNLRSALVRQAGDLCCPGGGLSLPLDKAVASLLRLPFSTLNHWPYWPWWQKHDHTAAKQMTLFYAAALREGVEEMRLNPLGLTFLGSLPTQHLVMFKRTIYPQVAWINRQRRFFPNWEVERIIYLPIKELLNPENYARYRLVMSFNEALPSPAPRTSDFLCYIHHHCKGSEILWGATFRITMDFLRIIFNFHPPRSNALPVIERSIDETYLNSFGPK